MSPRVAPGRSFRPAKGKRRGGGPRRGGQRRPNNGADRPSSPLSASAQATATPVEIQSSLTVNDLAIALGVPVTSVIKVLVGNGVMATINQVIDFGTAEIVAQELGFEVIPAAAPENGVVEEDEEEGELQPRPPIVTILGHVDHGKTSLLDAIRLTNVTEKEAGGITQHIGAYQVEIHGNKITFLDTPGHEAFTAMRARGAQVTDIAILVVAADDGVQPQTIEAIDHARAANVPIIVAVNKIDKPEANPDRVKQQLSDHGLVPEEWGGSTVTVGVSAKKREGIEHLLEMILLVAEIAELKADPDRPATGAVVEAKLDKTRGPVATILVQNGTLKVGDYVAVGGVHGRVRAMFNDRGKPVRRAEPATPVEILGLPDVPQAGDVLRAANDEKTARQRAQDVQQMRQAASLAPSKGTALEDIFEQIKSGEVKDLNLILKTDVQGSIEPLRESLLRISTDEVKVQIIREGTGNVTESDVLLAQASQAIIIGFNVRVEPGARRLADASKIDIRLYDVIYQVVEDIQRALTGMLEPTYVDVVEGHAEVRQLFKVGKTDVIAGCMVTDGRVSRNSTIRVLRGREKIFEGGIRSLRRFKDDVRDVAAGYECGIAAEGFNDWQPGDIVESVRREKSSAA